MALAADERKARRIAGIERMTAAQRVHRALTTGRPPVSEMRSPASAVGVARVLKSNLESRMIAEGLDPQAVKYGVAIVYVSPDLSFSAHTVLLTPETQSEILQSLEGAGNVPVGLIFGIQDLESPKQDVHVGIRPFLNTKQTDEWLTQFVPAFHVEILDPAHIATQKEASR